MILWAVKKSYPGVVRIPLNLKISLGKNRKIFLNSFLLIFLIKKKVKPEFNKSSHFFLIGQYCCTNGANNANCELPTPPPPPPPPTKPPTQPPPPPTQPPPPPTEGPTNEYLPPVEEPQGYDYPKPVRS